MGRFEQMRRLEAADGMLLATVLIWSLNFTVTKYVLNHGFKPLAYGGVRFGSAAVLFAGLTYAKERSFAVRRRDLVYLAGAAVIGITLNQVTFIYGTKLTTAATVALIFGMVPILTALFARLAGIEQLHGRFWAATVVSFAGVILVAAGAKGGIGGHLFGYVLDLGGAATWSAYSVAIVPLMTRYTASRISFYGLAIGVLPILALGAPQLASENYSFPPIVWIACVFAVVGPLFATNLLWFNSIERVGPSRAAIYTNLQPFFGAIFALLILSESFTRLQVVGGFLIAVGILLSRREQRDLIAQEQTT
jgi:drug/metabolite transporter (DMT)-like permease